MENRKINCIQVGPGADTSAITKKEGFTTNKNYLGHTQSGIPVYLNNQLKQGETKTIMKTENQTFDKLAPGKYNAKCLQVYEKTNETDQNKKIKVVELQVEGHDNPEYVTFFMSGYSDMQMEISKKNIDNIISGFKLLILEDLAGKQVNLVVKKNNKGYINYFIYAPQKQMDWNGAYELPCNVFSYSKKLDENCVILGVKFRFNGEEYVDFVWYNLDNEFAAKNFDIFCKKANLNPNAINPQLDINATLKVNKTQSKKDPSKWFVNKKLIIK